MTQAAPTARRRSTAAGRLWTLTVLAGWLVMPLMPALALALTWVAGR